MTASESAMDGDRLVSAVRELILPPGEEIVLRRDWPEAVVVQTSRNSGTARRADWLVGAESWVVSAVRVVMSSGFMENTSVTYGLLFTDGGEVLFLNDVATMRELGRRLGAGLDPVAYAELLSEIYSGKNIEGPVVTPYSATESHRAGELIRDVDAFLAKYPWVDADLVAAPRLSSEDETTVVEFYSCHYYLTAMRAVDLLRWRVTGGADQPGSWQREYAAEALEHL